MCSLIGGLTGDDCHMHRPVWVKLSVIFPQQPDRAAPGAALGATASALADVCVIGTKRRRGG
jgi:hypothetical protein